MPHQHPALGREVEHNALGFVGFERDFDEGGGIRGHRLVALRGRLAEQTLFSLLKDSVCRHAGTPPVLCELAEAIGLNAIPQVPNSIHIRICAGCGEHSVI